MKRIAVLLTTLICIAALAMGCAEGLSYTKTGFFLFNLFEIKAFGVRLMADRADKALTIALESVRELDRRLNELDPISDINALNGNASARPVKVSPQVFELIEKSLTAAELTSSAYDLTIEPLLRLYRKGGTATPAQVQQLIRRIDHKDIYVDPSFQTVRFNSPGTLITFDLVKKGYAIDLIAKALQKEGVRSALIRSGNTMYVLGKKAQTVQINHPDVPDRKIAHFKIKDRAYSVILADKDPLYKNAGVWLPIMRAARGVSENSLPVYAGVSAPNAVTAEALVHALFILGSENGMELIRKLRYDGIIIVRQSDGTLKANATDLIRKRMKML